MKACPMCTPIQLYVPWLYTAACTVALNHNNQQEATKEHYWHFATVEVLACQESRTLQTQTVSKGPFLSASKSIIFITPAPYGVFVHTISDQVLGFYQRQVL